MSESLQRLKEFDTCVVSDALDRVGIAGVAVGLGQLSVDEKIAGHVRTVELAPDNGEQRNTVHLGASAILAAAQGDVIVVAGGRSDAAGWGGLLTFAAQQRGVAGVIVDGACRDIPEALEMGFPIYGRGAIPTSARKRLFQKSNGETVVVCGVSVAEGDYVVADASGVVFVPRSRISEVISIADEIATAEAGFLEELRSGTAIDRVLNRRYEALTQGTHETEDGSEA